MPKNTSVPLGDHFAQFVDGQVSSGRFASVSEVLRVGLRLLEEHEYRVSELRAALIEGEESGEPRKIGQAEFLKGRRASLGVNG